jgi:general secretion pathway protein C
MNKARLGNWFRATRWPDLLEFALLAVLAVALAQWTWIALTPRPVAASAHSALPGASAAGHADASVKRHLFGAGTPGLLLQQGAAPASSLRLLGVVSPGTAGKGRAIFALDRGARKVANVGETLSAGVVLKEVHADHVVVTRDGAVERIVLDRRAAAALPRQAGRDAAR